MPLPGLYVVDKLMQLLLIGTDGNQLLTKYLGEKALKCPLF